MRVRPGRHRPSDVRHRRLRRDARAQSKARRCAFGVLRHCRRSSARRPVGAPLPAPGGRPLRLRAGRVGERRRLPIGGRPGNRGGAARGADPVRHDHVGAGDRTRHSSRPKRFSGDRVHARLLDDGLRARRGAQSAAHPGDAGGKSDLHPRRGAVRDRRQLRASRPRADSRTARRRRSGYLLPRPDCRADRF